ncbi:14404_t:CDS:1, partial [Racocetra persica]
VALDLVLSNIDLVYLVVNINILLDLINIIDVEVKAVDLTKAIGSVDSANIKETIDL